MQNIVVVQAAVDGVLDIAVLKGDRVTILTDLAGPFAEVAAARWEGGRLQCSAWLGRDEEHSAMVQAAIEKALAARTAVRPSRTLSLFGDNGSVACSVPGKVP